ncbi:septum formation initiator family protein [Alloscardovia theropitheci]|uniref:Septum formation initiator family protein n=1 Tax=Alloscardovia theropitheci TaxID=2496842 RepID=A0A4R0QR83_9BIFI|nr:septum formation initiator family protein [Alloscardovia theropitheci]TCD53525.1 septum formation initiator family protein [Alloscardovia theropitheci]
MADRTHKNFSRNSSRQRSTRSTDSTRDNSGLRTRRGSQERVVRDELRDIKRSRSAVTGRTRNSSKKSRNSVQTGAGLFSFLSRNNSRNNGLRSNNSSVSPNHVQEQPRAGRERLSQSELKSSHSQSMARRNRTSMDSRGGLLFILGIIILLLSLLNIGLVFRSYAQNLGQLNALKSQEAALIQQKAELENDISRWSDDAYVTAQARKRLGFVYPGERSVRVENLPQDMRTDTTKKSDTTQSQLPWFTELLYAIHNTDQAENSSGEANTAQ